MGAAAVQYAALAMAVVSQQQQAKAAKKTARMNADIAEQNAAEERRAAEVNASRHERESRMRAGMLETATADAGIETTGSALDIITESKRQEELDRQEILKGGEARSSSQLQTAAVTRAEGDARARAANLQAGATLFSGLATA